MIFEMNSRVRYSEVDSNGYLTLDGVVNYLQDAVMLHSESVGAGTESIKEQGNVWFLSTWQIEINRLPMVYEAITVKTNPYAFKGFFGHRNSWIEDANGEVLVKANSIWVYLNYKTLTPQRIKEDAYSPYLPLDDKLEMEYSARKIEMPEEFSALPSVAVTEDMLDTNKHVNNCEYIKAAMRALNCYSVPKRLRVEYKKSALLGDIFFPYINKEDDKITLDLRNEANVAFATVVFEQ